MRRWIPGLVVLAPLLFRAAAGCGGVESTNDGGADAKTDGMDASRDVVPPFHRPAAIDCDASRPPGAPFPGLDSGCAKDDDCDAGVNGRCIGLASGCSGCETNLCSYDTCMSDDACAGHACTCREAFPKAYNWPDVCDVAGDCRVDTDCPSGFCSPSFVNGCGAPAYYCRTPADECIADVDCANAGSFPTCAFDTVKKHWACEGQCIDG